MATELSSKWYQIAAVKAVSTLMRQVVLAEEAGQPAAEDGKSAATLLVAVCVLAAPKVVLPLLFTSSIAFFALPIF